ncbi:hypothetical protein Pmar_PMAR018763 [Perkinsus marinus ATCC 50983]|uniref:Uncharacterized protein n=1 Tax=Perkinsus marinus (strain ATCC 50983 / TXsc) TaxID=423536 RepID=C5KJB0_PERM5|nr:hypothetical protein Pmar_PMAR018763 [Perkinsus marinus ATCC 50983]EER15412.1 hypothetical protein Pmar_PMAR018763 [Perkinsus marinus ATCC 50983]|eukprot:XP_002783616.1 hypothetical protein Pmar_PMAR018763 [Perkinsus marinus ATCC 50983]
MAKSKVSDLQQGIVTLERALALTTDTSEGSSLGPVIAKDLAKLYMRLAVDSDLLALCVEEAGHPQNDEYCKVALVVAGREWSAITCYERALECAKLSLDEAVEGIASYKLGAARDAAINQLEQLRVVAEDAGEITTAADACLNLAVLSYKEDKVKATELLESYYQLSCRADNRDRRDTAAVLLAFANGRHIIPHVADIFKEGRGIYELLRRKDTCMTNGSHANT